MLDTVETGIAMFDPDNRLVFCNASYGMLFELPPELLLPGTKLDGITRYFYSVRPESRGGRTLEAMVDARRANLRIPHEGVEVPVGERWYLFTEHVLVDGSVIAVRTDISAVKLAQARLIERSERLGIALRTSSDALRDWNVETNQNSLSPRWYDGAFTALCAGERSARHAAATGYLSCAERHEQQCGCRANRGVGGALKTLDAAR